jgi:iron complex outermembrane receptor protein
VFNGRIALADIPMEANGAKVTVALWARNLFNEQHLFYKTGSAPRHQRLLQRSAHLGC